jgi:hypothetical protein
MQYNMAFKEHLEHDYSVLPFPPAAYKTGVQLAGVLDQGDWDIQAKLPERAKVIDDLRKAHPAACHGCKCSLCGRRKTTPKKRRRKKEVERRPRGRFEAKWP